MTPMARFGDLLATGLCEVTTDPAALDSSGFWAVVSGFEGWTVCARFRDVRRSPRVPGSGAGTPGWRGPAAGDWFSSLDRDGYLAGVRRLRDRIAAGEVYQANLCRVLTAALPDPHATDVDGLAAALERGNPAPYAGVVRLPTHGVEVASASPELYLRRRGAVVESGPIKGTGRTPADLTPKDHAENVMIVDLVRNDLGRTCAVGSVEVPELCAVQRHPGLSHLVSTVRGELRSGAGWAELLATTFPAGSVTGAPRSSALRLIGQLEPVDRGPYCGAVGWVDADRGTGELAVGIRTFWIDRTAPGGPVLRFGTGAGITWGSVPEREWAETELKAARLLALAGADAGGPAGSRATSPRAVPAGTRTSTPVPGRAAGR